MNGINSGYSCNNSQLAPPPYNEDDHQIDGIFNYGIFENILVVVVAINK